MFDPGDFVTFNPNTLEGERAGKEGFILGEILELDTKGFNNPDRRAASVYVHKSTGHSWVQGTIETMYHFRLTKI